MPEARIVVGDCVAAMQEMPENSVDAVVTDPPYGLAFMGKKWDVVHQDWHETWARETLRVLKPGGHLIAAGGTRTHHRLTCAIEDAGFEIRDCITWLYGSGFPKSHNVGKAIDKMAGAEREVVGHKPLSYPDSERWGDAQSARRGEYSDPNVGWGYKGYKDEGRVVTAPATLEAQAWEGWGTALKPAHEPWVLARKPLSESSVARNVLAHGTGAINVAATRVGISPQKSSLAVEARRIVSSYRPGVSGDILPWPDSQLAFLERLQKIFRNIASVLLSYSSDSTTPSRDGDARDGTRTLGGVSGQTLFDHLYPNGAWRGLDLCEALSFQGDCLACQRFYDAQLRAVQEAAQESPASLADVLERIATALLGQVGIPNCQCTARLSSSDALVHTSALADLLLDANTVPHLEHQGRWPSNLILSHAPECVRVGTKRVKPPQKAAGTPGFGADREDGYRKGTGREYPDGTEEVESYECVENCPVRLLDEQSGVSKKKGGTYIRKGGLGDNFMDDGWQPPETVTTKDYAGEGGASRFFQTFEPDTGDGFLYQAKASRSERNAGLEGMPVTEERNYEGGPLNRPEHECSDGAKRTGERSGRANNHPTVKPLALMRYLVKMITPSGGTVLDPFCGSGSTGCAAILEGFDFIGIEQDEDYAEVAEKRIAYHQEHAEDKLFA